MRILLAIDSLEIGGAERHVCDLATGLRKRGHRVVVACSVGGPLAAELGEAGITVHSLMGRRVKRRADPVYAWRMKRLIFEGGFDLVHAHLYASEAAALSATRLLGVPLVVTVHSESTWQGPIARRIEGYVLKHAAEVIAVSRSLADRLEARGADPSHIHLVRNAIPHHEPAATSAVFPDSRTSPLIGAVARLQPEKGIETLLSAMVGVVAQRPDAHCVIIGDGPLRPALETRVRSLGIDRNVCFAGCRPNGREIISRLDILAVPSLTEGSPLVVLEGMTAGVPIVASAVGGVPEQIRCGREGVLVPSGDSTRLGGALLSLLLNPERARRLGEEARRRVTREFPHESLLTKTEAVYRAAAVRRRFPDHSPGLAQARL